MNDINIDKYIQKAKKESMKGNISEWGIEQFLVKGNKIMEVATTVFQVKIYV
jgi:hypothetical protein